MGASLLLYLVPSIVGRPAAIQAAAWGDRYEEPVEGEMPCAMSRDDESAAGEA